MYLGAASRRALVAVTALLVVSGCGGGGRSTTTKTTREQVEQRHDQWTYARGLFRELCSGCHTLEDAGTHGTRFILDNDPLLNAGLIRGSIEGGAFGMPSFGDALPRRELDALASYIDAVAKRRDAENGWRAEHLRRSEGETPRWSGRTP